jgi:two-component sensor histidine kinase
MTSLQGQFEPAGSLQEVLDYQDTLLREVNHRAKNSVTMAIGILRLQKQRSRALRVRQALDQAIHRLHHLAHIHDILSRQQESGSDLIDMPTYLGELCDGFSPLVPEEVQLTLHADPLELEAARAAPVALIVGEAISNAIKHAFPRGRAGDINVTLCRSEPTVALLIKDNGAGYSRKNPHSLGARLMSEMARSLGGVLTVDGDAGTCVSTSFLIASSNAAAATASGATHDRRRGSPIREVAPAWRSAPACENAD